MIIFINQVLRVLSINTEQKQYKNTDTREVEKSTVYGYDCVLVARYWSMLMSFKNKLLV